jgi:hypothetical protein
MNIEELVEREMAGEKEVLGAEPIPVPLCPP